MQITINHWSGSWTTHSLLLDRILIAWQYRGGKQIMGRFGGGWNWKLGVQWSRTSCIVSLLVAELSFNWLTIERAEKLYEQRKQTTLQ